MDKNLEIDEKDLIKLKKEGVIEITTKFTPLLIEYNTYRLNINKLIDRFISKINQFEKLIDYNGLLNEYKILKIIEQSDVASPKLIYSKLPGVSIPTINRILFNLLEKGFIKKIEKGLYKLDEIGEKLIK